MENSDSFNENKVIGNVAEAIVEFLINSAPDWKCIRFGVENHINDLKKVVRGEINAITKKIKSMPDFIAFNSKTGETFFIEVKYRGFIDRRESGKMEFKLDFLKDYSEHWEGTKLILVHGYKPYFFVVDLKDVRQDMCRKEHVGHNDWEFYWNFADIQKGIKDVFPELTEESIKKAVDMIPEGEGYFEVENNIYHSLVDNFVKHKHGVALGDLWFYHGDNIPFTKNQHAKKMVLYMHRNVMFGHYHDYEVHSLSVAIDEDPIIGISVPASTITNPASYGRDLPNNRSDGFGYGEIRPDGSFDAKVALIRGGEFMFKNKRYKSKQLTIRKLPYQM